ncbi:MAG: hypothetical protein ACPG7E_09275 [Marinirhabdus sp.]
MRTVLFVIFAVVVVLVCYGFYIRGEDYTMGEFCIGAGIAGLFFLWMPLFIYHRWRKRKLGEYMLTKENIEKMRAYSKDKKL